MNKFQAALNELFEILTQAHIEISKNIKIVIKELIDEKVEFESRKDYLKEGSKWEGVAICLARDFEGDPILATKGAICIFKGKDNLMTTIKFKGKYYSIPNEQFLLCYKPIKEGELNETK